MIELKKIDFRYTKSNQQDGSGKSTLLKIIAGLIDPQNGEVLINGKSIKNYKQKDIAKKIGYVPQFTTSVYPFSVYEIVMMGRTPHLSFSGYENNLDREIVKEALEFTGIYHLRNKGINEVSGGEAQRAFIARAFVQQPQVILLDEPNAHLDIRHQISIFNLLKKFNIDKELTIIAVSHDLNLTGHYGRRGILMNEGMIKMDDDLSKILTEDIILENFGVNSKIVIDKLNNEISVIINPH